MLIRIFFFIWVKCNHLNDLFLIHLPAEACDAVGDVHADLYADSASIPIQFN